MENQLIRGQVFDVLFNYAEKWGSICTESDCATVRDEICLRIDQSQFTADEAEDYINQEVEKRIAERMPSEEEINAAAIEYATIEVENEEGGIDKFVAPTAEMCLDGIEWLRNQITEKK